MRPKARSRFIATLHRAHHRTRDREFPSTGQTSSGRLISRQSVTAPGSGSDASVLVKDYRIDYDTIRRLLRMRRPLWYWVLLNVVVLVAFSVIVYIAVD